RNPPRRKPIKPGRPTLLTTIGPSRITPNTTRNSKTGPDLTLSASTGTSGLRPDQRHVAALTQPTVRQLPNGAVRLQGIDRRVDELYVRRPLGQRSGEVLVSG